MPLDDLLGAIDAEAREEISRLRAGAEAEAETILSEARREAARTREEILRASDPEDEANRHVALARLEAGRIKRAAREEVFTLLLARAREELATSRGQPGYRATLWGLLGEALAALPGAGSVRVHPDDEGLARELVRGTEARPEVIPTPDMVGGIVVESADAQRLVRNTFEERLANAEPHLRPWYGRRLETLVRPDQVRTR